LSLSSVSKLSSSPTLASNSFIAATILDLLVVSRLVISLFFFPSTSIVYSAPITSLLLSAWVSTSLIASTNEVLLSVFNCGIEVSPEALFDKLPISDYNSFIASIIVMSFFCKYP